MTQSGQSVMDFAIQAELDGAAFYAKAAAGATDPATRSYLEALAAEERGHAETVRKIKQKAEKKGALSVFTNPEVDDYLDAVLRGGLFESARKASSDPDQPATIEDVYKIAIRAERSSILLYEAMLEGTKAGALKNALRDLIREEKAHLVKIVALRAERDSLFVVERFGCLC